MDSLGGLTKQRKRVLLGEQKMDARMRSLVSSFFKTIELDEAKYVTDVYKKGRQLYILTTSKSAAGALFLKKETLLSVVREGGVKNIDNVVVM